MDLTDAVDKLLGKHPENVVLSAVVIFLKRRAAAVTKEWTTPLQEAAPHVSSCTYNELREAILDVLEPKGFEIPLHTVEELQQGSAADPLAGSASAYPVYEEWPVVLNAFGQLVMRRPETSARLTGTSDCMGLDILPTIAAWTGRYGYHSSDGSRYWSLRPRLWRISKGALYSEPAGSGLDVMVYPDAVEMIVKEDVK